MRILVSLTRTLGRVAADNSGSTLTALTLSMPLLIGALAISVEAAYWYKSKSDVQLYADMASHAGALELLTASNDEAETYAILDAMNNGFDFNSGTIEAFSPPISGSWIGDDDAIEVVITEGGTKFFSGYVSHKAIQYRARAVSAIVSSGNPACIVALNETDASSFEVSGSTDLVLNGCAIHSNSVHGSGTKVGNRATLDAECLSAVGGIIGDAELTCGATNPGADPEPDPYASLPVPDITGMACQTVKTMGTTTYLEPGLYCDDISVNGNFEFRGTGEYYFNNADLNFGRHANASGAGITLILMNDSALNGVNGNATIDISAQTSGPYAGVVIYSDPTNQPADQWTSFKGNSSSSFGGLMYYPNQNLNWGGTTSGVGDCTLIVANKVVSSGTADMTSTGCASNYGIKPPSVNGTDGVYIVE